MMSVMIKCVVVVIKFERIKYVFIFHFTNDDGHIM